MASPIQDDQHHFDFDLDRGIRLQVVEKLDASPFLPLESNVGPQSSGIYALYYRGKLVYIGKASRATTKSGRTLRARLNEHVANRKAGLFGHAHEIAVSPARPMAIYHVRYLGE